MPNMGIMELVGILFILILYSIPIVFAVGVIVLLKRILSRLIAIEQRISQINNP
jgi:hypothetical protein